MSIVDRIPTRRPAHTTLGFTALEVMVCLFLVATMAIVVQQTMVTTTNASQYVKAVQRATQRGHDISYEVREELTSSRRLFFDEDVGNAYKDALEFGARPPVPWSRLPMVDEAGRLEPDSAGLPLTGNMLVFAQETDATSVLWDPAEGLVRHIDTYRFVAIYIHETDRRLVFEDGTKALDLVLWTSIEYPSYKQIVDIEDDDERAIVVQALRDQYGHTLAWNPSADLDEAFVALVPGGVAAAPTPGVRIEQDPDASRGGRLVYADVQLARTQPTDARRRAVLSADDPEVWRPHGFEVKVVGPSGARQVWMNLVTESQSAYGQSAAHSSRQIISARDL